MRRNSYGSIRVGRLMGACAVIGALVAFPLAGAGQSAPSANLKSFGGEGTGYSLGVVVDLSGLPTAAKEAVQSAYAASGLAAASDGRLPAQFPFVIDQTFIETLSDLGKTNHGRAQLIKGLLSGEVVSADVTKMGTKDSSDSASEQLPHSSLPLITMSAGKLTAAITAIPQVTSAGSIASIRASLASLSALLPAEVKAVFDQVLDEVNGVIATANTGLDTALGEVATAYDAATAATDPILGPVLAQANLEPIVTDAADLQAAVPAIPEMNDLLGMNAASINGLGNKSLAEQSGDKVFADASSKLGSLQLLGLLKVGALDLKSHSEAAGTPGSARNTNSCTIGTARLGASGVALDGKSLLVDGLPVPVPAVNIPAVKGAVDQVLSAAGLAVGLCETPKSAAAKDGTSASQTVSALKITIAPTLKALPAGTNALGFAINDTPVKIMIDPTVSTAASATVNPAVAPAAEEPVDLPRTGAGSLPIILIGSIAAAGGALYLMRHRLASLVRTK